MRTLIPILLVVFCLAATLRVEGVWPPESVRQQVENTIEKVVEPGQFLAALLGEYFGPKHDEPAPFPANGPATLFHTVVESPRSKTPREVTCS